MNTIHTKTIFIKTLKITYYETGSSDIPLLLLHGGGADSALLSWKEVLQFWGDDRRLIAVDLPSYGQSDAIDTVHSVDFFCQFVDDFLTELHIDTIHICGLSMGGAIALQMALQKPKLIKKMILIAPWGIAPDIPWRSFGKWLASSKLNEWTYRLMKYHFMAKWTVAYSLFGDKTKISDELIKSVQKASLQEKSIKAFQSFQMDEIHNPKRDKFLLNNLVNIHTKTLLVQGEKDPGIRQEYALSASKLLPNARLIVFENHKHWLQKESPKRFIELAQDFLNNDE